MEPHKDDHPEVWSLDYTARDHEVVDYEYYDLGVPGVKFRGPQVPEQQLTDGNFFTCLGAAQTKGIYIGRPCPDLLGEQLGVPALNLGLGGCGAGFYLMADQLLTTANQGRFVVLQVMTARTEGNSRLQPFGFVEMVKDRQSGEPLSAADAWMNLFDNHHDELPTLVAESMENWRGAYHRLLDQISVPVVLFNFAHKSLDDPPDYDAASATEFLLPFPQFVDRASVEEIAARCDGYVECTSTTNFNHPLISRFTGEPVEIDHGDLLPHMRGYKSTTNHYYPSAEMHQEAAQILGSHLAANASDFNLG